MLTATDWKSHTERAYQEVLLRPPIAREREKWTARLPGPLLRWRLQSTAEYRRGVVPFMASAGAVLELIEGRGAEASDARQLHGRWREALAGAPLQWRGFAPPRRELVEERTRAIDALFAEVLMRPPDDRTCRQFVARWCLGLDDLESLRRELIEGDEHARLTRSRRAAAELLRRLAALDAGEPEATDATDTIGAIEAQEIARLQERWRRIPAGELPAWVDARALPAAVLAERARAVDALFAEVLMRPPDPATRRQYVARSSWGLDDLAALRRELIGCDEHARLAQFRRAASGLLRQLEAHCGQEPDARAEPGETASSDIRCLHDRWRQVSGGALPSTGDPATVSSAVVEERARAVDALFAEVLLRPPDRRTRRRALARWLLGVDDLESLHSELDGTTEYAEIVGPLVALVREVHQRYVHRPPSTREIQDAVDRVRTSLRTRDELVAAIADGTVRRKLGIRPLKLEMDVTTQCNLRCTMCYFADPRYGRRERVDVSPDDFRRLARQVFPYCGLVSLSFGTEPLLHPRLSELLEIAAEEEVPWRYLITNGLLLDEHLIDAFVRVPLHGFSVSIDAATAGTYERIRAGGRWEKLMANLRGLQEAKRRAGSEYPRLTFNFVMMRSNLDELPALVRLAHELGAEGISATHLTSFDGLGLDHELLHTEPERCNGVLAATRAEAERLGIPVALPEPFDVETHAPRVLKREPPIGFLFPAAVQADAPCPFPWQFVGIDPYGKVVPCGWWYTQAPMGDVHTQSFADIWDGPAWRALRREHASGELRELCLRCPAAGMGSCDNPRAFDTVRLG